MKRPLLLLATIILCATVWAQPPQGISHQAEPNTGQNRCIMHSNAPEDFNQQSLEQLLNPDGTLNLNSDFSGSIDPTGFQMITGPAGEPRFVREEKGDLDYLSYSKNLTKAEGDENWDQFPWITETEGVNNHVLAIAVSGNNIYVGGHSLRPGANQQVILLVGTGVPGIRWEPE